MATTIKPNTLIAVPVQDSELLELVEQIDAEHSVCSTKITDENGYGITLPSIITGNEIQFVIPEALCFLKPKETYNLSVIMEFQTNAQILKLLECNVILEGTETTLEGDEDLQTDSYVFELTEGFVKPPVRSVDHVPEDVLAEVVDLAHDASFQLAQRHKQEATKPAPVAPEQFIKVVEQELKEQRAKKMVAVVPSVPKTPLSPTAQSIKTKMKQVLKAALK